VIGCECYTSTPARAESRPYPFLAAFKLTHPLTNEFPKLLIVKLFIDAFLDCVTD